MFSRSVGALGSVALVGGPGSVPGPADPAEPPAAALGPRERTRARGGTPGPPSWLPARAGGVAGCGRAGSGLPPRGRAAALPPRALLHAAALRSLMYPGNFLSGQCRHRTPPRNAVWPPPDHRGTGTCALSQTARSPGHAPA